MSGSIPKHKERTEVDGLADGIEGGSDVGGAFILALPGQLQREHARRGVTQVPIDSVRLAAATCMSHCT
jgi:hypothetical protein